MAEFNYRIVNLLTAEGLAGNAVARCEPEPRLARRYASEAGVAKNYVWAETSDARLVVRPYFSRHHDPIDEEPGKGSACANLGGWMFEAKTPLRLNCLIYRGDRVGRPCGLRLRLDKAGAIVAAGRVIELGRGAVSI